MAWNQPNQRQRIKQKQPIKWGYAIIAIGVVLLLGTFYAVMCKNDAPLQTDKTPTKSKFIKEHKTSTPSPKATTNEPKQRLSKPKIKSAPPKPAFMTEKPRSEWDSREVAIAYQWYAKDPANRIEGIDMKDRIPPPVFSNQVQEAMAPYLEIGADVLPIGRISDDEALEAIDTPIVFNHDDPDDLLERKQGVKKMLAELKECMDQGGHAQDYFLKLESRQSLEFDTMQEVRNQVRSLEKEGDDEGAREALEAYNKYLESKGLPRIHMKIRKLQPVQQYEE